VDPADTESITQAILEICANAGMREELSARALARASLFGWDSTAGRIMEMIEGTVNN
jgi:glycosyltransferase involved in cell wall biosynthesis